MTEYRRIDPRIAVIEKRLGGVGRVIGVGGSKGGIGKSISAVMLALTLADQGRRVGLFDLDFTSPSDHVALGVEAGFPAEKFGIEPRRVHGIDLMSVAFFAGTSPIPFRGIDATNALLELLAITRWGDLDYLILDWPPGLGDIGMDVIRLIPRLELLMIAGASRMVIDSVRRAVHLFVEQGVSVIGLVDNMSRGRSDPVARLAEAQGVPFLGSVPFDSALEESLGDASRLRSTELYRAWTALAKSI